jgi:outer membrane biosynthesis protein TonB
MQRSAFSTNKKFRGCIWNPQTAGSPYGQHPTTGKGLIAAPTQNSDDGNSPFVPIQIESTYKGGPAAWLQFLGRNFHLSEEAVTNGIQGTVIVQFKVDEAGNVSDVQVISGPRNIIRKPFG